ncbi:hypothetical protein SBP02_11860 [Pseudomonas benzenivorans]|uniref:Uncharacterized protein n=1 Tax=Pseudomonas benzenivorans TaxID=556533 RepID=A0ABZ0PQQ2_9PSED|nr:hypothetical protein [Pseudomonas benzenivorans]WPC03480.1 hypothetical protein SBP02_11860 [Pseudomonas benzenivorans]
MSTKLIVAEIVKAFKDQRPADIFNTFHELDCFEQVHAQASVLNALSKLEMHEAKRSKAMELSQPQIDCYKALAACFGAKVVLFEIAEYPVLGNEEVIKKLLIHVTREDLDLVVDRFFQLVMMGNYGLARLLYRWIERVDKSSDVNFGTLFNYIAKLDDKDRLKIVLFSQFM